LFSPNKDGTKNYKTNVFPKFQLSVPDVELILNKIQPVLTIQMVKGITY